MHRLFACALLLASTQALPADLVLHNGKVWTGDAAQPAASAIAIHDGRIVAVGSDAEILKLASATSRQIDLKGRRVVPGINDAHTHVTVGLVLLFLVSVLSLRGQVRRAHGEHVEMLSWYWHFVDVVWVVVFTVVYLNSR